MITISIIINIMITTSIIFSTRDTIIYWLSVLQKIKAKFWWKLWKKVKVQQTFEDPLIMWNDIEDRKGWYGMFPSPKVPMREFLCPSWPCPLTHRLWKSMRIVNNNCNIPMIQISPVFAYCNTFDFQGVLKWSAQDLQAYLKDLGNLQKRSYPTAFFT